MVAGIIDVRGSMKISEKASRIIKLLSTPLEKARTIIKFLPTPSEKARRIIELLSISIATYITTTLLLIELVAPKDLTLWQILVIPSVYVVLLIFLVVNIIVQLLLMYPRLQYVGITMAIVGITAVILHSIAGPQITETLTYDLVGFGVGAIGSGVGLIGVGIAKESDNRMKAMAELQFDQALSTLVDYYEESNSWYNMYYHARGALYLAPWASEEKKRELKRVLNEVMRQAKARKETGGLVLAIEQLWSQYGIDEWPDGDSLPNTVR